MSQVATKRRVGQLASSRPLQPSTLIREIDQLLTNDRSSQVDPTDLFKTGIGHIAGINLCIQRQARSFRIHLMEMTSSTPVVANRGATQVWRFLENLHKHVAPHSLAFREIGRRLTVDIDGTNANPGYLTTDPGSLFDLGEVPDIASCIDAASALASLKDDPILRRVLDGESTVPFKPPVLVDLARLRHMFEDAASVLSGLEQSTDNWYSEDWCRRVERILTDKLRAEMVSKDALPERGTENASYEDIQYEAALAAVRSRSDSQANSADQSHSLT